MRFAVLAAVASFAVATPALADDFAGPYVGAGVTLDNVQGSGSFEGEGFSGIGGTAFAGYDFALGSNVFAGAEANIDVSSADVNNVSADWAWGIGARLGYKLNDSTALYGRVGYAQQHFDYDPGHDWFDGVRYGAGIQTGLTDQLSLRGEFSQYNYENNVINNQVQLGLSYGF